MLEFKQFLNEDSQSSSHYALKKHGWELGKQEVGSGAVKYIHKNLPGHEIHLSKGGFFHQDKTRDKDVAYGPHADLHNHLEKIHSTKKESNEKEYLYLNDNKEEFEKIISTNDVNASDVYTPNKKNEEFNHADDVLKKNGWKYTHDFKDRMVHTHQKYPGHEIHFVNKNGNWHHWDKQGNSLGAGFTGERLQNHLKDFQKEDYGDPADFRVTQKSWEAYNPVPMDDRDDTEDDKNQITGGECVNYRDANDLGPFNTKGMGISNENIIPSEKRFLK